MQRFRTTKSHGSGKVVVKVWRTNIVDLKFALFRKIRLEKNDTLAKNVKKMSTISQIREYLKSKSHKWTDAQGYSRRQSLDIQPEANEWDKDARVGRQVHLQNVEAVRARKRQGHCQLESSAGLIMLKIIQNGPRESTHFRTKSF